MFHVCFSFFFLPINDFFDVPGPWAVCFFSQLSSTFPQFPHQNILTRTKLRRWKSDLHKQAKIRVRSFHDRKVLWKFVASRLFEKQHAINDSASQWVKSLYPNRKQTLYCKVRMLKLKNHEYQFGGSLLSFIPSRYLLSDRVERVHLHLTPATSSALRNVWCRSPLLVRWPQRNRPADTNKASSRWQVQQGSGMMLLYIYT